MPIMLFNTFSDILKSVTMILPPATLRIFFCIGILDLVKENVVIDSHLNPYLSVLGRQCLTGFYGIIQGISQQNVKIYCGNP